MTVFAVVYFGTALAVTAAVYFMSLNSEKKQALKTVLLIVYILAFAGLVFPIYLADTFCSKKAKKNE